MIIGTGKIEAKEVITALDEAGQVLTLATCAGNRVTIRPMSYVNDGMDVYFQTCSDSVKMRQIRANPNVALCVGTYEMEGRAVELGHPLVEENTFFVKAYKEKHPGSYERYSSLNDEIVVKVTVGLVRQWRYVDGNPILAESNFGAGEHEN